MCVQFHVSRKLIPLTTVKEMFAASAAAFGGMRECANQRLDQFVRAFGRL